jgi:hypothetical protein
MAKAMGSANLAAAFCRYYFDGNLKQRHCAAAQGIEGFTKGTAAMVPPLTLAFSSHRIETLPRAEAVMASHAHIVIEEPPTPEVRRMLAGTLSLEGYLQVADYDHPVFAAAACRLLRRLHRAGKRIHPCEPFMDRLIRIHAHFTDGGRPAALESNYRLWPVYQAEREATGRLLAFYRAVAAGDFNRMVHAACSFAAADASRFLLRDQLRAVAIARLMEDIKGSVYIEAGYMHLRLLRELRRLLPREATIRPVYLLREVYRTAGLPSHFYGPGDVLTLALIFGRKMEKKRQHLLAARSLVYNQLIVKEEVSPGREAYPDARDDLMVIQYVNQLDYGDCRRLYGRIAGLESQAARRAADGFPPSESVVKQVERGVVPQG